MRRNLNPALSLGGLLLTMYDSRTNLSQQVAEEVRRHFPQHLQDRDPAQRARQRGAEPRPAVGQYAPSSPAARAYRAFAAEFIGADALRSAGAESRGEGVTSGPTRPGAGAASAAASTR